MFTLFGHATSQLATILVKNSPSEMLDLEILKYNLRRKSMQHL